MSTTPATIRTHDRSAQADAGIARQGTFPIVPHRMIDIGHSKLAYWKLGRGPDLVFVHGWPLHSATFRGLLPHLTDRFTCHLVDLPGAGKTTSDAGAPIDFVSHASAVRKAIDALGLTRYALLAHDSGGLIARLVAAGDRRVAALVMGDTEITAHHSAVVRMFVALARTAGGVDLVRLTMHLGALRRSGLGFGGCFENPEYVDGEFHDLFVAPMLASRASMARQFELFRTLDMRAVDRLAEVHARIAAPVQLIWGTDDPIFPIAGARRMLGEFAGGAVLHEIARGKAFVHDEHPAAFAAHAKPFLLERMA